jgi:hypothetical protein
MMTIAAVREAEAWSAANIVGGIALLLVVIIGVVWLIRRYLNT